MHHTRVKTVDFLPKTTRTEVGIFKNTSDQQCACARILQPPVVYMYNKIHAKICRIVLQSTLRPFVNTTKTLTPGRELVRDFFHHSFFSLKSSVNTGKINCKNLVYAVQWAQM